MNIVITWIAIGILALGGAFLSQNDGIGAISFPTSVDTLTNPSATGQKKGEECVIPILSMLAPML